MNVAAPKPWTSDEFLAWSARQPARFEFDGTGPVAMTGGTVNHALIMRNLHRALDTRLRNAPCQPLGPDVGVATAAGAIRYPDALVTCAPLVATDLVVPGVVAIFEIVSPGSVRVDRILKVREYATIPTMRRYVILESATAGVLLLHRTHADDPWTAQALILEHEIDLPELNIRLPIAEIYAGLIFDDPRSP